MTADAALQMFKTQCPLEDCQTEFYARVPTEFPHSESIECPSCDEDIVQLFEEPEDEDVLFYYSVEVADE